MGWHSAPQSALAESAVSKSSQPGRQRRGSPPLTSMPWTGGTGVSVRADTPRARYTHLAGAMVNNVYAMKSAIIACPPVRGHQDCSRSSSQKANRDSVRCRLSDLPASNDSALETRLNELFHVRGLERRHQLLDPGFVNVLTTHDDLADVAGLRPFPDKQI